MKPIETIYNGYKFRSRLEARWAVFFDALNIKYEYEKEGYEFENGQRYLPDFYLPRLDCWIEIKGELPVIYDKYWNWQYKKDILYYFSEKKLLITFFNIPGNEFGFCKCLDTTDSGGGDFYSDEIEFCYSKQFKDIRLTTHDGWSSRQYHIQHYIENENTYTWEPTDALIQEWDIDYSKLDIIESAYKKARQARFEFNEINN